MSEMTDQEDLKWVTRDTYLGRRIMNVLQTKYPGHGWMLEVKSKHGIFNIWNKILSKQFGYVQRLAEIEGDKSRNSLERVTMRIAGELLERAQLKRGRLDEDELVGRPLLLSGDLAGVDRS